MNFRKHIITLLFLFLISIPLVKAQSTYRVGTMPSVNISRGLTDELSLNFKVESRQSYFTGTFSGESSAKIDYLLTDLALILSKKVGLNNKLAGGYLASLRKGETIHKTVQQFTIVRRYSTFRVAHRLAADQAFAKNSPTELRFRYRFTGEFPLNGEEVDPREMYLKINNEYLNGFEDGDYDLEIRLAPLLGYVFADKNKFEFGLDYRVSSFIGSPARNSFWLSLNWYLKI